MLREGVIEAVGADVEPPADARIWEHDGLTVYPGLIEPYAVRPWPEKDDDEDDGDDSAGRGSDGNGSSGGHDNAQVTPERDMALHAFDEASFKRLRRAGYTSAVVAPEGGIFRGTSALVNLGDGGIRDTLLRGGVAQNVTFASQSGGGYPVSLMGAVALVRQTLHDARWYRDARAAYESDPGQKRPAMNAALAALGPVAAGETPAVLETKDVLGTLRAAALVGEFGLDALLVGNGEEYKRLDAVAATGLVHLLPLDFPDPPDVGDDGDALDVTLEELRHWDLAPENPARLLERGVRVAFTSHELGDPKEIHARLATAIERGLSADDALAGLTTVPAEILGVADRLGTVEAGKIGNLLVVEGDLFTEKPKLREVWVDGRRFELKESKPPEVNPVGTWQLDLSMGEFEFQMTLEVSGSIDALSGTLHSPFGTQSLGSMEVSGKKLLFESTSPMGTSNFELEIDGERMRGTGSSPRGTVKVKGKRTSPGDAASKKEAGR